jgi:formylglycine-generating enzyme required for sulfatase activity
MTTLYPDDVGSESPAGDGAFGQSDLAGNVCEYVLDWDTPYVTPCVDCANLTPAAVPMAPDTYRVERGGSAWEISAGLLTSHRFGAVPANRDDSVGARCARSP